MQSIDRVVDLTRTATNVMGQVLGPVSVAGEGILDEASYSGHAIVSRRSG
jgi:Na+/H+-dicarboxylate symporter